MTQPAAPAGQTGRPRVGDEAPDFELRSQHGERTRLSSFRGHKRVVVLFYPYAFSTTCTGELCEIRDDLASFQNEHVQVLAISCDSVHTLRAFAEHEGYDFPLLSDFWPHGVAAKAYGVFNDKLGAAERGSFLVDEEGLVRWSVVTGLGQARDLAGYHQALAAVG
ncbi:MAG: peroxiredoxin [Actinomycetales bacterium]